MRIITTVKNFFITFLILLVSQVLTLLVANQYVTGDPGLIQLGFALFSALLLIYSLLFVLIDLIKPSSKKYIILFNSAFSFLLAFMGILFYTSDYRFGSFPFIIICVFLIIHFFVVIYRKNKKTE